MIENFTGASHVDSRRATGSILDSNTGARSRDIIVAMKDSTDSLSVSQLFLTETDVHLGTCRMIAIVGPG